MTARRCNECTLCCKLMPVKELHKAANTKCEFQRSLAGCIIHEREEYPHSCRLWSCVWLADASVQVPRPDRSHYVIDPSPDFIELGTYGAVSVVQIWNDPKHPGAHRDPQLRAWLQQRFDERGQIALVRFDSMKAIALFPPNFPGNETGEWFEKTGTATVEHSAQEKLDVLRAMP